MHDGLDRTPPSLFRRASRPAAAQPVPPWARKLHQACGPLFLVKALVAADTSSRDLIKATNA